MLYLNFGEKLKDELYSADLYFKRNPQVAEWFNDPVVKQMVLDIDKTEVISAYNIISPFLGGINYNGLSTGVKTLIYVYKIGGPTRSTQFGDNCCPWLLKIAKDKDINIRMQHCLIFGYDIEAMVYNTDIKLHNGNEYGRYCYEVAGI